MPRSRRKGRRKRKSTWPVWPSGPAPWSRTLLTRLSFRRHEMNPRDFLAVASDLVNKASPSAADLRTAVGRAYYALFNSAVEFLTKCGISVLDNQKAHREVPRGLRHSGDRKLQ